MRKYLILLIFPFLPLYAGHKCGYSDALDHYYGIKDNQLMEGIFERVTMQNVLITPSGHFAIHYDNTGYDAVDNTDLNQNNIPDYIDSVSYYMDRAYEDEVVLLGFPFSEFDNNAGGTEVYDIYVKELLDSPYYGGTKPEGRINGPDGKLIRTSFIVIDNNYSKADKKYRTTGIDGMKITLYHEFHHSIQFQMTDNDYRVMAEMSATFMEFRFFPEILDYVQWAVDWFKKPTSLSLTNEKSADAGYTLSIFLQYTYKLFGDDVVLNIWEGISKSKSDMVSLNDILKSKGTDLSESFCDFTKWMYRTGKNSVGATYFEHAVDLPELTMFDSLTYSSSTVNLESNLLPFTFSPYRVIIPNGGSSQNDTIIVILNNTDFENGSKDRAVLSKGSYTISENSVGTKFEKLPFYFNDNSDAVYCNTTIELLGRKFVEAYPSPYVPNKSVSLYIPAPDISVLNENVEIEIYTPEMKVVFADIKQVNLHNQHYVISISDSELNGLNNGIYLFKTTVNGDSKIGKFMVKK